MSLDPQPLNPFGWLVALLLGALFFFVGFQTSSTLSVEPPKGRIDRPPRDTFDPPGGIKGLPADADFLGVSSADAVIRELFPPQVTITVTGYWPDGCDIAPEIVTQREGSTIYIRIYRIVPRGVMCTQQMSPFTEDVTISELLMDGDTFQPGTYSIDVNGIVISATF